jgi:hypothetical protein
MNRLSNYFAAAKLAKLLLIQADEDAKHGKIDRALRNMNQAIREVLTAQNNIASIAFNPRKKVRS